MPRRAYDQLNQRINQLYNLSTGANDYTEALKAPEPHIGAELVEAVIGNISTAVSILVDGGATR